MPCMILGNHAKHLTVCSSNRFCDTVSANDQRLPALMKSLMRSLKYWLQRILAPILTKNLQTDENFFGRKMFRPKKFSAENFSAKKFFERICFGRKLSGWKFLCRIFVGRNSFGRNIFRPKRISAENFFSRDLFV